MITIDYKSTGTLLNELITANLKLKNIGDKPAFRQRITDLELALLNRKCLPKLLPDSRFNAVANLFVQLQTVLEELWWAVEETIKLRSADPNDIEIIKSAGYAALKAFELNAKRCDIIRDMDAILGEKAVTFLEKSY